MVWAVYTVIMMLGISLAHHLGLVTRAAEIVNEIAGCSMCSTFWGTLVLLCILGCPFMVAVGLSLLASYLSNWVNLLYWWIDHLYERLWQKMEIFSVKLKQKVRNRERRS